MHVLYKHQYAFIKRKKAYSIDAHKNLLHTKIYNT